MENKSGLKQVFALFCTIDEFRPAYANPFVVNGKAYATDGHSLVRCESDKIDFQIESENKILHIEKVIPEENTSEVVDIDCIDWASLMTEDELVGDGKDVECGHCEGMGTCEDSFLYKKQFYSYEYDCPVCDGSGYEEEEGKIPTGDKTFPYAAKVKFKGAYFYAQLFYKLKKVKDLVGGDIKLIYYKSNLNCLMFSVGILEILIMPCTAPDGDDTVVAKIA